VTLLWRWARRAVFATVFIFTTLIVGGAYDARWRLPDLKPWHRVSFDDVSASTLDDHFTLAQYLVREERVFAQLREFESTINPGDRTPVNRYHEGSLSHPASAGHDWNRSFETQPTTIRGGALLIHGLTDSPYSMQSIAEVLRNNGVYSLALRMPGHGTVPSGLLKATWDDWLAAVRMGVRHVRTRTPEGAPLILVGYSNGGALAVKYTLDAIEGHGGPVPSKLILISTMIGVAPAARLAWWISRLGVVPYFEKANWLDVLPEYNPFKYNSFPANAAFQTASLTRAVQADLARVTSVRPVAIPPILTFQSIVDATVSTPAVVHTLYDQLPTNGSELVLFDVNHLSGIDVFVQAADRSLVGSFLDRAARRLSARRRDERLAGHPGCRGTDDRTRVDQRYATAARNGLAARSVLADARGSAVRTERPTLRHRWFGRARRSAADRTVESSRREGGAHRRNGYVDASRVESIFPVRRGADRPMVGHGDRRGVIDRAPLTRVDRNLPPTRGAF